jgi:hypothetical protein
MTQAVAKQRQQSPALDQVPKPAAEDELANDIRATIDISNAVYRALSSVDLDEVRSAVGRGEGWLEGVDDLEQQLEEASRQARVGEIAQQIGLLLAGFPGAEKGQAAFVRLLCHDVAAEQGSIGAIAIAVRRLRRTWKPDYGRTLPSIAEILSTIATCDADLATAQRTLAGLRKRLPELQRHQAKLIENRARWRSEIKPTIRRALEYRDANARGDMTVPFEEFNHRWPQDLVDEVRREMAQGQAK